MQTRPTDTKKRIAALTALLLIFCLLTILVKIGALAPLENASYETLSRLASPALTNVMLTITQMGSVGAVVTIVLLLLILPATRTKAGLPVAATAIISSILNNALKAIIARPRPDLPALIAETGYGYPSGHAMSNAALYAVIVIITYRQTANKTNRALALAYAITATALIGASRVYLGVHSTGDVLAGWAMGIAVALLTDTIQIILQQKQRTLYV